MVKQMTEKMPKFMKDAIGQAQKQLTLMEGNARTLFTGAVEKLNFDPIRKRVRHARNTVSQKAASVIGLATQTDIRSIRSKIDRLREELRKITRRAPKSPAAN